MLDIKNDYDIKPLISCRWDDSFYLGGICIAISGFLSYLIGALRVESDDEEEDMNNNDETDERSKIAQRI